jgi:hypothetical protein
MSTLVAPSTPADPCTFVIFYGKIVVAGVMVETKFGAVLANFMQNRSAPANDYLLNVKSAYDIQSTACQNFTDQLYNAYLQAMVNIRLINQSPTTPDNLNLVMNAVYNSRAQYLMSSAEIKSENDRLLTAYDQSYKSTLTFKASNEDAATQIRILDESARKSNMVTLIVFILIALAIAAALAVCVMYRDYALAVGLLLVVMGICLVLLAVLKINVPVLGYLNS